MAQAPPSIVTPEAVVLEFEHAGVGARALPVMFDLFLQFVLLFALLLMTNLGGVFGFADGGQLAAFLLLAFVVIVGYPIVSEALWNGRTVGKAVFGLRVLTRQGAPIRFRHAALRGVLRVFEVVMLLGGPAVVSALVTREHQRLGDLAAGTIVVRERAGTGANQAVRFPVLAGYEPYVASLDVTALTDEQYGVVRSFLVRCAQLEPTARQVLAVRLANPVARRIGHQPPPGLHPEAFLLSVAAAYQQRHGVQPTGVGPIPPL
jgi:uncharacterized RDD family membrane protein YckC